MTPFEPDVWPAERREAATALWDFYHALDTPARGVHIERESERCVRGERLTIIPPEIALRAFEVCKKNKLDLQLLAQQVLASGYLKDRVRFDTAAALLDFVHIRCESHARLLAHLAQQRERFKDKGIREFAKAMFLTKRLCMLPQDLARDRLFVPISELAQFRVSEKQLKHGAMSEGVRRLLWKQAVRIRDAYGASQRLAVELTGWPRQRFKHAWMTGLYYLAVAERNRFDVWTKPVALSPMRRLQIRWQILFGRQLR